MIVPAATGAPRRLLVVLMLAVFTVSVGFGVGLPFLPFRIERLLGPGADVSQISRQTGLLTALYMLSLFLFAPAWGHLSDRFGRRAILVIGLTGFTAATLALAFVYTLPALYTGRFISGMFAAAVTPVALAAVGDLAQTEKVRARQLTMISVAGISGVLAGPMLGIFVARAGTMLLAGASEAGSLSFPLFGIAILAMVATVATALVVSGSRSNAIVSEGYHRSSGSSRRLFPALLCLAFIVSAAVSVFEVGLVLRGKQMLGFSQLQIAIMFTTCSLVMIVMQVLIFFSPLIKPASTRLLITPAMCILAVGLFLAPRAFNFPLMLAVVGLVAASAGILAPILTYWISSEAGHAQGVQLGRQTAAASLGGTLGSAAGGLLFDLRLIDNAPFVLMSALTAIGVLLSLGLAKRR